MIVTAIILLIKFFVVEPTLNKKNISEIEEVYYNSEDYSKDEDLPDPRGNLSAVRNINEDIKGWIKINDTVIDYPVLQSSQADNSYYLYRNYKKESNNGFGSIFIDSLCDIENPSKNIILYGHNMRDSSMFGALLKYNDLNYYKARPVIIFDTINEEANWKIISIFKTNTLSNQGEIFDYLKIDFANDKSFLKFIYDVRNRSLIDIPVDVCAEDRIITLSTCSYELEDFRTVVVARKVREGESVEVDVDAAKKNPNPLMPAGYYSKYGGQAPNIADFEDALAKNSIAWLSR